jgi:hypothetical protein
MQTMEEAQAYFRKRGFETTSDYEGNLYVWVRPSGPVVRGWLPDRSTCWSLYQTGVTWCVRTAAEPAFFGSLVDAINFLLGMVEEWCVGMSHRQQ